MSRYTGPFFQRPVLWSFSVALGHTRPHRGMNSFTKFVFKVHRLQLFTPLQIHIAVAIFGTPFYLVFGCTRHVQLKGVEYPVVSAGVHGVARPSFVSVRLRQRSMGRSTQCRSQLF